jgi:S-adenosylmethionine-diacylgycerolhomoserine-N-methlytransferase
MSPATLMQDLLSGLRLLRATISGTQHQQRLDAFYAAQAGDYDRFRQKLLWGRAELMAQAAKHLPPNAIWYDFGAGTGQNLEFLPGLEKLRRVVLLDLCEPLLLQAEKRVVRLSLENVQILRSDACKPHALLEPGSADLVTFSYSLTMIPDWFLALEHACRLLKPGGVIAVVDFYVARRYAPAGHSILTRRFWPAWFGFDNVELSQDHLPYLQAHFEQIECRETWHRLPFVPLLRAPVYWFLGRKK